MSNLSESLGNMNSVEKEKDMTDNIYSPFKDGEWWEDMLIEWQAYSYKFFHF